MAFYLFILYAVLFEFIKSIETVSTMFADFPEEKMLYYRYRFTDANKLTLVKANKKNLLYYREKVKAMFYHGFMEIIRRNTRRLVFKVTMVI